MPHLVVSERVGYDILRITTFLLKANPQAARKMALVLERELDSLTSHPRVGRLVGEDPETRELIIRFGRAAYCALYTIDGEAIILRALKHSREAGY